jgi:hypothetical protein
VVQRAQEPARPAHHRRRPGRLLARRLGRGRPPRHRRRARALAFREVYDFFQAARAGEDFVDGAWVEFWRVLLANPEVLLWERFWLERNKDLDRELYGIVKWCNPELQFGLNVWNRNHFNFLRKAQWPWLEQTTYSDWVKPITYQHQSGEIYAKEQATSTRPSCAT